MNAIKPKLEQKDVGYGGMRAIGDAIGKQILELQDQVRQLQAENEALKEQVEIWEKEAMNARIKMSLYQTEIKELRKEQEK